MTSDLLGKEVRLVRVMFGFPGDVQSYVDELQTVLKAWNEQNAEYEGVVLVPADWRKNSRPSSGAEPQKIINAQIAEKSDVLIAVFGNRLGSPTSSNLSGTVEEIDLFYRSGKEVMLYFSSLPVPRSYLEDEYKLDEIKKLNAFKKKLQRAGSGILYAEFETLEDLLERFKNHLSMLIRDLKHNGFKFSPRETIFYKQIDISDIPAVNSSNYEEVAYRICLYALESSIREAKIRFRRTDLTHIYHGALDRLGIERHSPSDDYYHRQLYSEAVRLGYLVVPPNNRMDAGYGYRAILTPSEISKEENANNGKVEYFYSKAQRQKARTKLEKRQLNMDAFDKAIQAALR